MSRCWDVANFCPLVVLYNMSIVDVRVVEFGTYTAKCSTYTSDQKMFLFRFFVLICQWIYAATETVTADTLVLLLAQVCL